MNPNSCYWPSTELRSLTVLIGPLRLQPVWLFFRSNKQRYPRELRMHTSVVMCLCVTKGSLTKGPIDYNFFVYMIYVGVVIYPTYDTQHEPTNHATKQTKHYFFLGRHWKHGQPWTYFSFFSIPTIRLWDEVEGTGGRVWVRSPSQPDHLSLPFLLLVQALHGSLPLWWGYGKEGRILQRSIRRSPFFTRRIPFVGTEREGCHVTNMTPPLSHLLCVQLTLTLWRSASITVIYIRFALLRYTDQKFYWSFLFVSFASITHLMHPLLFFFALPFCRPWWEKTEWMNGYKNKEGVIETVHHHVTETDWHTKW